MGGVKVSKKIREYEVGADEFLEFFVVTHEEGRHELACPPPVDVSRGHRGAGPEVLGNVLKTEVLLDVLLPLFFLPPEKENRSTYKSNIMLTLTITILAQYSEEY
jgi:hypothetical protein